MIILPLKAFSRSVFLNILMLVLAAFPFSVGAQSAGYIENKGQWSEAIQAKYTLKNGMVSFMDNEVKLALIDEHQMHDLVHYSHDHPEEAISGTGHTYSMKFGSSFYKSDLYNRHKDYVNYFLGNRPNSWASRVGVYDKLLMRSVEKGIDVAWGIENGHIKYTVQVSSSAALSQFSIEYGAVRKLSVEEGKLNVVLPNLTVVEQKPYAYQLINNEEVEVDCEFFVSGSHVSFRVGEYDSNYMLFIDPVVVASTNSGSTVNTFGHSATFDQFGNIYGAGRPFGVGFPTDTGSFQMDFGGGGVDIGLTKMNEDGSQLLWSTYLGGNAADFAHSIVVNGYNQIIVYGKSQSPDYPVSANAVDTSHNGNFDIVVTILSDSGDALIGSTFIGGEGVDGSNSLPAGAYTTFKGEVETDVYSNIYIASTTTSDTFPVTTGAIQMVKDSLQDGVLVKLNYNASSLLGSTYFGGSNTDAAFGIKPMKNGDIVVCGSTQSPDFYSMSIGELDSFRGPQDAFLTKFNSDFTQVITSTFVRADSGSMDDGNFLQVDREKNIYILGESDAIQADTNRYQGPGTGSFIRKYSGNLDSIHWTSTFTSLNQSAFLVDNCMNIYAGGEKGIGGGVQNAELTPDAVQTTAGGFYIIVLNSDADSLIHGTYYGNSGSHVDGGTSRFDKRGAVYQATCSSGLFPLNTNAYSGNQSNSYDLTLFKIDFEVEAAVANAQAATGAIGCAPYTVDFTNYGSVGISHFWDFDDNGDTSNLATPSHTYDSAGVYEVTYVIFDTNGCILTDTSNLIIIISDSTSNSVSLSDTTCVTTVVLEVGNDYGTYNWSTGENTSKITVSDTGVYWVEIEDVCGVFTDTIDLDFTTPYSFQLQEDTAICDLDFELLGPVDADSFLWSTGDTTQNIFPQTTGVFYLTANRQGCAASDTMNITVSAATFTQSDTLFCGDSLVLSVTENPGNILWNTGDTTENISVFESGVYYVVLDNGTCQTFDTINVRLGAQLSELVFDSVICASQSFSAFDSSATSYFWSTGDSTSSVSLSETGQYWVARFAGSCSDTDTVNIVRQRFSFEDQMMLVCEEDSASLFANASQDWSFLWSNGDTNRQTTVYSTGDYWVRINSEYCTFFDTLETRFVKSKAFSLGADQELCKGESYLLNLDTISGLFLWSTGDTSRSVTISDSGLVWVSIVESGCELRDSINVSWRNVDSAAFATISNVITPNGDGLNDILEFNIANEELVKSYHLSVFNRWGAMIFESRNQNISWDAKTSFGERVPPGTYFYSLDCETVCVEKGIISVRETVTVLD